MGREWRGTEGNGEEVKGLSEIRAGSGGERDVTGGQGSATQCREGVPKTVGVSKHIEAPAKEANKPEGKAFSVVVEVNFEVFTRLSAICE